jgi:hypothetical protein
MPNDQHEDIGWPPEILEEIERDNAAIDARLKAIEADTSMPELLKTLEADTPPDDKPPPRPPRRRRQT